MTKEEGKKYLERLNLIFYSIIALPLCAFAWFYLENHAGRHEVQVNEQLRQSLQYVFPFLILVISGFGILIPGNQIKKINNSGNLKDRLGEFQRILLLRYALFEIACILSVFAYYLTVEKFYAVFFVGTIVLFSLNRPTPFRIISNLRIKGEDKEIFQ
ncbi:MAG TPA: hypothetical protein VGA21_12380 [Cyclobacteriaceae bacterium]|jgi:hypothetical protein